jgi:hypothetical protein
MIGGEYLNELLKYHRRKPPRKSPKTSTGLWHLYPKWKVIFRKNPATAMMMMGRDIMIIVRGTANMVIMYTAASMTMV